MNTDSKEALSSQYQRLRETWEFTLYMANISPSRFFYTRGTPKLDTKDLKKAVKTFFDEYPFGDHY